MSQKIFERNNVTITGEGEIPILFAHGFGCDQHMWRFITPAFKEKFKVILFDYVGFGNSDTSSYKTERYNTLHGYVQDVLEVIDALEHNDVIFAGHSVSSIIGALASIKEPQKFKHLIMIGPSPCYLNDPPEYYGGYDRSTIEELLQLMQKNYIGWAEFFAPEVMKNEDKPQLTEELEESFCSTDPVIAHEFAKATFLSDNREDLPKIDVPVLIIQCENDSIAPLRVGKYVHSQIKDSTLEVLPANGHCPHMSDPELTIEAIDNYLNQDLTRS